MNLVMLIGSIGSVSNGGSVGNVRSVSTGGSIGSSVIIVVSVMLVGRLHF